MNMMIRTELTAEQKAKRIAFITKIAVFVVIGVVVGPIVGLAIKGLIGLGVTALIGFGSLALAPVVANEVRIWKLKVLKNQAAANPIETLELEYSKRNLELDDRRQAVKTFISRVGSFEQKVKDYKKNRPNDTNINAYEDRLFQLKQLLETRKEKLVMTGRALSDFAEVIDQARDIWEISLAAIEADQSAGSVEDEFNRRLKVNTSLAAIQDNLAIAFAQLDVELLESKEPKKLPPI